VSIKTDLKIHTTHHAFVMVTWMYWVCILYTSPTHLEIA